ncbi:glutamate synthase-related protein [Bosea thiooxidans]
MIEIKLSQSAKPGHGGMLPGLEVEAGIGSGRRSAPRAGTARHRCSNSAWASAPSSRT